MSCSTPNLTARRNHLQDEQLILKYRINNFGQIPFLMLPSMSQIELSRRPGWKQTEKSMQVPS